PVPEPLLGAPRFAEPKSKPTLTMLATPIARQETISYHAVDFLTNRQTERRGYGVYTYVLFGRRINKTGDGSGLEPLPRYQALLDALAKSTEQVKTTPVVGLSDLILTLAESNVFYVPVNSSSGGLDVSNYNSDLGFSYRRLAIERMVTR